MESQITLKFLLFLVFSLYIMIILFLYIYEVLDRKHELVNQHTQQGVRHVSSQTHKQAHEHKHTNSHIQIDTNTKLIKASRK